MSHVTITRASAERLLALIEYHTDFIDRRAKGSQAAYMELKAMFANESPGTVLPFQIRNASNEKLAGRVRVTDRFVGILFEGFGVGGVLSNYGQPVCIELDNNRVPIVRVWDNIKDDDAAVVVSLAGAKQTD